MDFFQPTEDWDAEIVDVELPTPPPPLPEYFDVQEAAYQHVLNRHIMGPWDGRYTQPTYFKRPLHPAAVRRCVKHARYQGRLHINDGRWVYTTKIPRRVLGHRDDREFKVVLEKWNASTSVIFVLVTMYPVNE